MPSQIIRLPRDVFDMLRENLHSLNVALQPHAMELSAYYAPGSIEVRLMGRGSPSVPQAHGAIFAFSIVREQSSPYFWPHQMPSSEVLKLLDRLDDALALLPTTVSAHDLLASSEAIERARQLHTIGRRPIKKLLATSDRQVMLLQKACELGESYASELRSLDSKLESYQAFAEPMDIDFVIERLSTHSELAKVLRLREREGVYPAAELAVPSRRGSLAKSIDTAQNLEHATDLAQRMMDSHRIEDAWPTLDALDCLNRQIMRLLPPPRLSDRKSANPLAGELPGIRRDAGLITPAEIVQALQGWLDDMHPGRWMQHHPLVWATISLAEFLAVRPFQDGNGRLGRLLFSQSLRLMGFPGLPWEAVVESHRADYERAVHSAIDGGGYDQLLRFMLLACDFAIKQATSMAPVIAAQREKLKTALMDGRLEQADGESTVSYLLAECLVSGILVEGFTPRRDVRISRKVLSGLAENGLIERVLTPHGTWFSLPAIRQVAWDGS